MGEDEYLDGDLHKGKIEKCICKLKNNKTGGSDGLVGKLLTYRGSGNGGPAASAF